MAQRIKQPKIHTPTPAQVLLQNWWWQHGEKGFFVNVHFLLQSPYHCMLRWSVFPHTATNPFCLYFFTQCWKQGDSSLPHGTNSPSWSTRSASTNEGWKPLLSEGSERSWRIWRHPELGACIATVSLHGHAGSSRFLYLLEELIKYFAWNLNATARYFLTNCCLDVTAIKLEFDRFVLVRRLNF